MSPALLPLPLEARPLLALLDRLEPQVLLVVGSGVSFGATGEPTATWKGLLLDGVDHLERLGKWTPQRAQAERTLILDSFGTEFVLDEVLQRADSLSIALGAPDGAAFIEWLGASLGTLKPLAGRTGVLDALRELVDAGALLLTTNYDDLACVATGLPAVTWEEPEEVLRVVNRASRGVIHIHGHWRRPSSLIFGKKSYDRIAEARDLQSTLQGLWQQWHWVFVGCGSGLDDPNLGRLLSWGRERFGSSGRTDFFLGQRAHSPETRSSEPARRVDLLYPSHDELPSWLNALTPQTRPWPFVRLDATSPRFRQPDESPRQTLFPSYQEYVDGEVPRLAADEEVTARLNTFGWAFVLDIASVGKTTLALRLATSPKQREQPVFYLKLREQASDEESFKSDAAAALRRIARPGVLLILDDVHLQPELANELWQQWQNRAAGSRLLILGTRIDKLLRLPSDTALLPLERHPENSAVSLRPSPQDLSGILMHVINRFSHRPSSQLPSPPPAVLETWYRTFGAELGAFVAAVTERLERLSQGQWSLPESSAAEWMRERHLGHLAPQELENAICLAVFGAQDLDLDVQQSALPHPEAVKGLLARGLAERTEAGGGRWVRFGLREPGWGILLLAAVSPRTDRVRVLAETAARNVVLAGALAFRLSRNNDSELRRAYWEQLEARRGQLAARAFEAPLSYLANLASRAAAQGQLQLAAALWQALADQPERLTERAIENQLIDLGSFLTTAQSQGQAALATALWEALAKQPERLAERAFETQLIDLGSFLTTARSQGQAALATALWEALAKQPDRLAERAFDKPLHLVTWFLAIAQSQSQADLAIAFWEALAKQPERLAERGFETQLSDLGSFLTTARSQGQAALTTALWEALAKQPERLAERAFEAQLDRLGSFLATARSQGQVALATALWEALAKRPDRLAERAFETPLHCLASFLTTAWSQGQAALVTALWEALAKQPERLAERAFEMPLGDLGSFLTTARSQGQEALATALWEALAKQPEQLAERAFETPLEKLGPLLATARSQGQAALATALWEALAEQPERLAERAFESPLDHLGSFLATARSQGHVALATALWEVLAKHPERLAERAFETPLAHLGSFLTIAWSQGQAALATALWEVLVKRPERLAERAFETPLAQLGSFLGTARSQGQAALATSLWEVLAEQPERLALRALEIDLAQLSGFFSEVRSARQESLSISLGAILLETPDTLVQMALKAPISVLGAFLSQAPDSLSKLIAAHFNAGDWPHLEFPHSIRERQRAASLALRLGQLDRTDLQDALLGRLLERSDFQDFAPPWALVEIAKVLTNIPAGAEKYLERFLREVCARSRWIEKSYEALHAAYLAGALFRLGLQQSPVVISSLWRPALDSRLFLELANLTKLEEMSLGTMVQFLGAAQLIGGMMRRDAFLDVPLARIADLPRDILPHREETADVEPYQMQLWLGLRVIASMAPSRLVVEPEIVARTLRLWRGNLEETAAEPDKTPYRVNLSMVAWLERCVKTTVGLLVPNPEPLWVLAGFPRDPRTLAPSRPPAGEIHSMEATQQE